MSERTGWILIPWEDEPQFMACDEGEPLRRVQPPSEPQVARDWRLPEPLTVERREYASPELGVRFGVYRAPVDEERLVGVLQTMVRPMALFILLAQLACDRCITVSDGTRYGCDLHRRAPVEPEAEPDLGGVLVESEDMPRPGHARTSLGTGLVK